MSLEDRKWISGEGSVTEIYRSQPHTQGTYPGLIIFPSIFGITDELIDHADKLAATGAYVVVFNPFSHCDYPDAYAEDEMTQAMSRVNRDKFEAMANEFRDLLAAMKQETGCNGKVIGLGICLGGPFVFSAAADGLLDGVAAWHGSRMSGVMNRASDIKCPVILDYGDADPIAPPEEISKVQTACQAIENCIIRVHPGAGHGFSHTGWQAYDARLMTQALHDLEQMLADQRV